MLSLLIFTVFYSSMLSLLIFTSKNINENSLWFIETVFVFDLTNLPTLLFDDKSKVKEVLCFKLIYNNLYTVHTPCPLDWTQRIKKSATTWQHNNNRHYSLIFTHFHSFSLIFTCCHCLFFTNSSHVVNTHFSLIFTHFYSFSLIFCCLLSVVTSSLFFKEVYLSLDTPLDIFTHFHSFSLISTVSHLFFINFHSFSLIFVVMSSCRHVVILF